MTTPWRKKFVFKIIQTDHRVHVQWSMVSDMAGAVTSISFDHALFVVKVSDHCCNKDKENIIPK